MREFDLLQHVYSTTDGAAPRVEIGPGDDMAMLRLDGRDLLAAVDQLVAGRHVDLDHAPLELIGRKAVTRSLSDVAAMAARPVASLAAVVLPPDFGSERATGLFDAMRATAEAYGAPLIGGDISFHGSPDHPLTCSVTVLAEPGPAGAVRRVGARAGDDLYVTGALGGAIESGSHLTFEPRIRAALELAEKLGGRLHAMIDLSDGLGRDASHLAEAGGVAIEIDAKKIPRRSGLDWRRAAGDGEDYELLLAATGDVPETLLGELPVTRVGRVLARTGESSGEGDEALVTFLDGAVRVRGETLGWQHES